MTDSKTVSAWIDGYRRAWDSNAPDDIRALFTDDAEYRTAPFQAPRVGVGAIIAGWIEDQDQPGDYTFNWSEAGTAGNVAFVEGDTLYSDGRRYANLWGHQLRGGRARHLVHRVVHAASDAGRGIGSAA